MKIEVTFQPVFHLPLTLDDTMLLSELARHHYDGECKAAGNLGGFIYGWSQMISADDVTFVRTGLEASVMPVRANLDQIHLALKVLELRRSGLLHGRDADLARADTLARDLRSALDRWPYIKPAAATIDTQPQAAPPLLRRDELTAEESIGFPDRGCVADQVAYLYATGLRRASKGGRHG